jgi:hypothetical protein
MLVAEAAELLAHLILIPLVLVLLAAGRVVLIQL